MDREITLLTRCNRIFIFTFPTTFELPGLPCYAFSRSYFFICRTLFQPPATNLTCKHIPRVCRFSLAPLDEIWLAAPQRTPPEGWNTRNFTGRLSPYCLSSFASGSPNNPRWRPFFGRSSGFAPLRTSLLKPHSWNRKPETGRIDRNHPTPTMIKVAFRVIIYFIMGFYLTCLSLLLCGHPCLIGRMGNHLTCHMWLYEKASYQPRWNIMRPAPRRNKLFLYYAFEPLGPTFRCAYLPLLWDDLTSLASFWWVFFTILFIYPFEICKLYE